MIIQLTGFRNDLMIHVYDFNPQQALYNHNITPEPAFVYAPTNCQDTQMVRLAHVGSHTHTHTHTH